MYKRQNIYILDTDGNVKDTVTLNGTDDTAGGNIPDVYKRQAPLSI